MRYAFILLSLLFSGCSCFAPWECDVAIDSEPRGAEVILPGERLTTPCTVKVPTDEDLTIVFRKRGYETRTRKVHRTISTCGMLDAAGAWLWLVPAVGLFTPGAYRLEERNVLEVLRKEED